MTSPTFGVIFNRTDTDPRPPLLSDLSVIGLVLPSDDADSAFLPLNEPVEFNSSETTALSKLGTGDLFKAVTAINDQLADFQTSARIVAVRVAEGADDNETIANIVGNSAALTGSGNIGTGIHALLRAGQQLGVIPRLIGAPGYTWQTTTVGGSTNVSRAAKDGGNTGTGDMTLGTPAYDPDVQVGVYQVRCYGGAKSASSAAKTGGNTGNGTMGSLTADAGAAVGEWRVICEDAVTDGGTFVVLKPDGTFDGLVSVGDAYNSPNGLNFTIADGSTDFIVGDEFVVTVEHAVPANGGVFSVYDPHGVRLLDATVGVAYDGQVKFTIADGSTDFAIGDGFDVTVAIIGGTTEANPICAALPGILNPLIAHAVVGGPGIGLQAAQNWFETLTSGRFIAIDAWVKVSDGVTTRYEDGVARVLGLAVRTEFQHGGYPFWTWANKQVAGIVGLKSYHTFSLTDGATVGQEMMAAHIGTIERGEIGVETAIDSNGYKFIGTFNADTDPIWWFYNKSRGRDFMHLALLKSVRRRLGAENVTPHGVQAVLNDMVAIEQNIMQHEGSIGFKVGFEASVNNPNDLRQGKFRIFINSEEPAPIMQVTVDSRPYYQALEVELAAIVAQAASIPAQYLQV